MKWNFLQNSDMFPCMSTLSMYGPVWGWARERVWSYPWAGQSARACGYSGASVMKLLADSLTVTLCDFLSIAGPVSSAVQCSSALHCSVSFKAAPPLKIKSGPVQNGRMLAESIYFLLHSYQLQQISIVSKPMRFSPFTKPGWNVKWRFSPLILSHILEFWIQIYFKVIISPRVTKNQVLLFI